MRRLWLGVVVLLVIAAGVAAWLVLKDHPLSIDYLKLRRGHLLAWIEAHYPQAVLGYLLLCLATALFLPGALALIVAGGMLFGTLVGALLAVCGMTAGAAVAFLAARTLFGHWVQRRFQRKLETFNREMANHGPNYLLVLRIVPVAPFFVINYGAALTRIPLGTFIWTTAVGMLPGCLVYTFAGEQLRQVQGASDLVSGQVVAALVLLGLSALVPVVVHHWRRRRGGSG